MMLFDRLRSTGGPKAYQGSALGDAWSDDRWYSSTPHVGPLAGTGAMSAEVALTLSAFYAGVSMIAQDIAAMPCQMFRYLDGGDGKERTRNHPLAELLRWQTNSYQTAFEFWQMMVGQYLCAGAAYAEIIEGPRGFADQLIPIYSPLVKVERLANRRVRYVVTQPGAGPRVLTQDQVYVANDFSLGGLQPTSRVVYAARSILLAIIQEKFTTTFFQKGATASLVATHKGGALDEEENRVMHGSITRYLSGVENAGGLLLVEDDVEIKSLSTDLEKAQLVELKASCIHDVERWLKLPPGTLGAGDTTHADAAVELSTTKYGTSTLRPICTAFEQAIRKHLILAPNTYFAEFNMDATQRGDLAARAAAYEKLIASRVIWPSEARARENLNPDPRLDALSEMDRRPGTPAGQDGSDPESDPEETDEPEPAAAAESGRARRRAERIVYDQAERLVRKEIGRITDLATKHAAHAPTWRTSLGVFYDDHAKMVAQTMRVPPAVACGYCAGHRALVEGGGVAAIAAAGWEQSEAEALTSLALDADAGQTRQTEETAR